jgi:serine phosphatase RsbU (regulator of sigma subunit)
VHCLEVVEGADLDRRHRIGGAGLVIGRSEPADLVLADTLVSRAHCRLLVIGAEVVVTDLESTNGTFIDGERITGSAILPVGGVRQVGRHCLKHEWLTDAQFERSEDLGRDLAAAYGYVRALLPSRLEDGPIRADWLYEPFAKLGGDAFGYAPISDEKFALYLIDVSGHGAGAAMHSVAVMNLLRQRALPHTDMADPSQVLACLNAMFQMDRHAEMYFTMWYGVYDLASRRLDFASAGHHPAYLVPADRSQALPLRTRNGLIGATPGKTYVRDSVVVPSGASIYLFSDGVFEIVTKQGVQWALQGFLPLMQQPLEDGLTEPERLYRAVRGLARPGGLDDDFSLVVVTFL